MSAPVDDLPTVLCLAGPTGCGKTALGLILAEELKAEIINGDSRQVYADFPIITAQPTSEEQARARHYLYGFLPADQKLDAQDWAERAVRKSREITSAGKLPLIIGGTGFYFEALLKGLSPMPPIPTEIRSKLQRRLCGEGQADLHRELTGIDPVYAQSIHPHDSQRILRALEIWYASGKPFSWWHMKERKPLAKGAMLVLDVSLDWLTPRLRKRIAHMFECGATEEITTAKAKYPDLPKAGFSSLGCRELLDFASGKTNREECESQWLGVTRAYAKRQLTWFRGRGHSIMLRNNDPATVLKTARELAASYQ